MPLSKHAMRTTTDSQFTDAACLASCSQTGSRAFVKFTSNEDTSPYGEGAGLGFSVAFTGVIKPVPKTVLFLFLGIGCGVSVLFVLLAANCSRWHQHRMLRRLTNQVSD